MNVSRECYKNFDKRVIENENHDSRKFSRDAFSRYELFVGNTAFEEDKTQQLTLNARPVER